MIQVDTRHAWLLEQYAHSLDMKGYVILSISSKRKEKLHRRIYADEYGPLTSKQLIDHKNRDKQDNRVENLRLATPSQNAQNQERARGFKGVSQLKTGRWMARICREYTSYYLGVYKTKEEALAAYDIASKAVHGDFGRTNASQSE